MATFEQAAEHVKTFIQLLADGELLDLYALYKQSTLGDVAGNAPWSIDFKKRAKYDAWAKLKGKPPQQARADYVTLVEILHRKYN